MLVIDVIVMLLLGLTIVFCWRLNNKITDLRSGRKELLELIKSLDNTIIKTHTNINELKNMSQNSFSELSILVSNAKANIADLAFINETAMKLADRLERGMKEARYLSEELQNKTILNANAPANYNEEKDIVTKPKTSFTKAKEELMSVLKMVNK